MRKLIFVYNATSDLWSKYLDMAHKIVSPSTYKCDLCRMTHGNFSEKQVWKDFKENNSADFIFIYKNEFLESYTDDNFDFPIVFEEKLGELTIVFDAETLASFTSIDQLIDRLSLMLN